MSNYNAMTGAERKAQLLEAGAKLAAKHGATNVTRRMVAAACGVAEGLVTNYLGDSPTAQKAYARKAKALGLTLPDKATTEAIGVKMRAHGPRDKRDSRKRSAKEVKAIKNKGGVSIRTRTTRSGATIVEMSSRRSGVDLRDVVAGLAGVRETKPKQPRPATPPPVPSPGETQQSPERKSAARAPKEPPTPNTGPRYTFP